MPHAFAHRLDALHEVVGDTPLFVIHVRVDGRPRRVLAKAEHFNLTGSIKDRIALHVLRRAHERGSLPSGAPIAEATSGNTGISFAAIGRALGHPVTVFMPDWLSAERSALIRSFGAEVRLVSRAEDGFLGCLRMVEEFSSSHRQCFLPNQFGNPDNVEAQEVTGRELEAQADALGAPVDAFVAGVGTGGTVMGVGRVLKARWGSIRLHPVEPAGSPTLSRGSKLAHGSHRIQGISDDFVPAICDLSLLDGIIAVEDGDAIVMAQRLAAELGIGVGISSGANLVAAVMAGDRLCDDAVVATVFPDDNKKYLSTDLLREEPRRDGHVTQRVDLVGFDIVPRAGLDCGCRPEVRSRRGASA